MEGIKKEKSSHRIITMYHSTVDGNARTRETRPEHHPAWVVRLSFMMIVLLLLGSSCYSTLSGTVAVGVVAVATVVALDAVVVEGSFH